MQRALQSACEAVVSSYLSMFRNEEIDSSDSVLKSSVAPSAAETLSNGASSSVGETSAELRNRGTSEDEEEVQRVNSAFFALLKGSSRGLSDSVSERFSRGPIITPMRHCLQYETWDCGIACLVMVLRWLRDGIDGDNPQMSHATSPNRYGSTASLTQREMIERAWMIDAVDTESVWTIDVVVLLENILDPGTRVAQEFPGANLDDWRGVRASYLFCSTKLGVDESYNHLGYYKSAFDRDEVRVTRRFQLAKELGLPTLCVSKLDLAAVVDIVSCPNCIAVVLLDNIVLMGPIADSKAAPVKTGSCVKESLHLSVETEIRGDVINLVPSDINESIPEVLKENIPAAQKGTHSQPSDDSSYAGHYVILCGVSYDAADVGQAESNGEGIGSSFCMVMKNPSSCNPTDFVTPAHFERAWRANGTDDDILFIAKK
mmetsp:Transcript_39837/g.119836  ORF Transcript_39837/g.119836 Transcript_39837/m.119836 type:complete len:431 (-) Transcript_39837:660-1952(-)